MREVKRVKGWKWVARAAAAPLSFGAALAIGTPWSSAVAEPLSSSEGSVCEAAEPQDVNAEAAELMRRIVEAQAGQNPATESDFVVLNNRGYNYGPPPGVRFDPLPAGRAPLDPEAR
jgi:hypothetical protein